MGVVFTAWDYDVTYLELSAFFVAIIAVWLASVGTRWAWPFYFVSAVLYAWLFIEFDLLASALLQIIFMVAAVWGWFDWGRSGVSEAKTLSGRWRLSIVVVSIVAWLALTPVLNSIGAAATLLDAFVLVGSVAAQVLMVRGYVEAWAAWVVVNVVGTYHYAQQQLYFTGLLYFVLLLLAVWGWWQWSRKPAADSAAVEVTDVIEVQG
ncbi:MAG: nicotinamide riboside transporter PnuC [Candidatus Nanopelagicales bacterium]|jgi:nicotinamide mononucleotide transporter